MNILETVILGHDLVYWNLV